MPLVRFSVISRILFESNASFFDIVWHFHHSAHEYTSSNAKFALSVEPGNQELVARADQIMEMRARNEPTVPSKIGEEKRTNPFLRVDVSEEIRNNVGVTSADTDEDAFGKVRKAKDNFRG